MLVQRRKVSSLWGVKREWILQVAGDRVKQLRGWCTQTAKCSLPQSWTEARDWRAPSASLAILPRNQYSCLDRCEKISQFLV